MKIRVCLHQDNGTVKRILQYVAVHTGICTDVSEQASALQSA
jgi:hypothetical protein